MTISDAGWTYKYFKTDHLGSTRAVLAAVRLGGGTGAANQLVCEQRTDYYPFGMAHATADHLATNPYLFSGKELQTMPFSSSLGSSILSLYDFGSRHYDPALGRWFNVDPAIQFVSPYTYCGNNPHMYVDPNGEFAWLFIAAMAYMGGVQSNFFNEGNPFNPGNWNWGSANTYIGIIGGAIGGAGMVGYNMLCQIPGMLSNGALQSGIEVALNGLGNITEDRPFFDGWYIAAGTGLLTGAAAGRDLAKSTGRHKDGGTSFIERIIWMNTEGAKRMYNNMLQKCYF